MTSTCKSCGKELIDDGGKGRKPSYCSTACRRESEFRIRRINRLLEKLEDRAIALRDPYRFAIDRDGEAEFVQDEIAAATNRLRALFCD